MTTSVKGYLRDSAGNPIRDAVVMITDGSHPFNEIASVTDDQGIFHLSNLTLPGHYRLHIEGPKGTRTADLQLEDDHPIEITW